MPQRQTESQILKATFTPSIIVKSERGGALADA